MFCTECGTKLEDGATICTNCGYNIPAEAVAATAAAAENVATPVAEPVQSANQSMYAQPAQSASQSMYSQPAQGASQSMYSQPVGATAGMAYGASQGNYGAQNADASYNYNVNQPQKKKGKGCLVAAIIGGVVLILGIIIVIIAIVAGLSMIGNSDDDSYVYDDDFSYSYDYEDSDDYDDYDYDDTDESDVPDELDDMMDDADDYDYVPSTGSYTVTDIYGYWEGTSQLVSVSGAAEMQEYLEGLIGRSLTEDEIAGLTGESAGEAYFWMDIFEYEGWDGFWDMDLDMGDYFLVEPFDTYDAVTYDQFAEDDFSTAVIELDSNNCFEIEVMERDYIGEYGCQFFDAYDYDVQEFEVEEDGAYGIVINGQVVDGSNGPEIQGEIVIMFQYGDMSEPYGMAYEYTLTDCYEY